MSKNKYPGVYIEENLSDIQPVEGVRTTIVTFVGQANSGPPIADSY